MLVILGSLFYEQYLLPTAVHDTIHLMLIETNNRIQYLVFSLDIERFIMVAVTLLHDATSLHASNAVCQAPNVISTAESSA